MDRPILLVVDDDPDIRKAVSLLFGTEYDVVEARDGRTALEAYEERSPRVVLMDISMPGMDGIEALRRLKADHPAASVVMLTGETDLRTAQQALEAGARTYITKPIDFEVLRAEVKRLMDSVPSPRGDGQTPWRVG